MNDDSDNFDYRCDCCGKGYYAEVGFGWPTCCPVEEQIRARKEKEEDMRKILSKMTRGIEVDLIIEDKWDMEEDERPY